MDKKYRRLALAALHEGLLQQEVPENSPCTKQELIEAFEYSGSVLRENRAEQRVRMVAETTFETCIRLARCLFFPQEARLIFLQGREQTLDPVKQVEVLRRNVAELRKIAEG